MSDSLFVDIPAASDAGDGTNIPQTIPEGDETMEDVLGGESRDDEEGGPNRPLGEEPTEDKPEAEEERSESPSPFTMSFLE